MKPIKDVIAIVDPIINSTLDAFCIVADDGAIVHTNFLMKSLLGLKPKDLEKRKKFSEAVELSEDKDGQLVQKAIEKDETIRFDETPAVIQGKKMRVAIKITPLRAPLTDKKSPILGAIIVMRDTTAELLTQAKYHKVTEQVAEMQAQIDKYKEMLVRLRATYGR